MNPIDERENIEQLLPWYVNGTLSSKEQSLVSEWLAKDEELKQQEAWLRQLQQEAKALEATKQEQVPLDFAWQSFKRQLDSPAQEKQTTKVNWWASVGIAACLTLVVQLGYWQWQWQQSTPIEMLSGDNLSAYQENHWLVQVQFSPNVTMENVAITLNSVELQIISGPSALGIYHLAVPKDSNRFYSINALELWLMQQPAIASFALLP